MTSASNSELNNSELSNALLAISQSLSNRRRLVETLQAVLSAACTMTRAPHGNLYVLDNTSQSLTPNIVQHNGHMLSQHPWQPLSLALSNDTDPFKYAVRNGEAVKIEQLYQYNGYNCESIYHAEQALSRKSENLLAWPLVDDKRNTVGLLVLFGPNLPIEENALAAFCHLAANYIRQAIWLEEYDHIIQSLTTDNAALTRENKKLKKRTTQGYQGPIAVSETMVTTLSRIDKILALPVDVLLLGETGTGKEVIAQYIHDNSDRSQQPLVVQNCAAIPEQLLESELFGHKKGAFTGADSNKIGLFEAANGGTLFLDEIGDMPLLLQAKLLRVLQERKLRPIGANKEITIDVRVIAATHCHLKQKIKQGLFRADLYYRLNVFPIQLPPLRERRADIIPLAENFLSQSTHTLGLPHTPGFSANVRQQLLSYPYPGNVEN